MTDPAQNYLRDKHPVIFDLMVAGIVFVVLATTILPEVKDRVERADEWCEEKFGEDYRGLGNSRSFYKGGAHCMLENYTWVHVPDNLPKNNNSEVVRK